MACGGVLRDENGKWISEFAANLRFTTALETKIWGLYYRVLITWESGQRKVIVESDSKTMVDILGKDLHDSHPLHYVMYCIKQFLNRDWIVKIQHIYRKGNRVADKLANWGLQQSISFHRLLEPFPDVIQLLLEDCREASFPKHISV